VPAGHAGTDTGRLRERLSAEEDVAAVVTHFRTHDPAAYQIEIILNTACNYIRAIYDKLHVHCKNEAARKALRRGLIR
jgi:DNA-binding NarL/FixJ family response regulator